MTTYLTNRLANFCTSLLPALLILRRLRRAGRQRGRHRSCQERSADG